MNSRTNRSRQPFLATVQMDVQHFARAEGLAVTFGLVVRLLMVTQGFQFVFARRVQDALGCLPLIGRPLRRIWWWLSCLIFGSEIAMDCTIDGGLYVPHPYGIVLGVCDIGRNVTILQNVTIGARKAGDPSRAYIGDDVYLAAGAVLLGQIRIGLGATVAANAVVMVDVPPRCIAAGVPARIIGNSVDVLPSPIKEE